MPFPIDPACITSNMSTRLSLSYRIFFKKSTAKFYENDLSILWKTPKRISKNAGLPIE